MIKVGLTGSIGSGKTTVAKVFHVLGIHIYHADEEARKLMNTGALPAKLQQVFSNAIMQTDGTVDRKALAEIVFRDPQSLERLNAIIHPEVERHFYHWLDTHHDDPYIIHEAAILYESGFDKYFDKIITVTAPLELRVKRVVIRDNVREENVMQRIHNQWDDQKKVASADFVINNNEKELILPQILKVHQSLMGGA